MLGGVKSKEIKTCTALAKYLFSGYYDYICMLGDCVILLRHLNKCEN